jgi:hypothetical protein
VASKSLTFDIYGRDKTAGSTIRGLGNDIDGVGGKFKKFGAIAAVGLAAVAAGAIKFGADSVKAYAEAQEAQNRLQFAYEKFPALADVNIAALRKLNEETAKKTRFDDDAFAIGEAQLAQYGLTGKQIMDLTPLMADYAAKTGKDIPSAAEDLGKALLGQGRALKAIGIDFEDTGSVAGNFDAIMGGLRAQVGGFAETDAQTAAGKLENLRNRFGEVQEKVGEELMPVLDTFVGWLESDGMVAIEDFTGVVSDLGASLAVLKEQDWFSGLTDALGEGGSLDLVGGGFFENFNANIAALPQSFANGFAQIQPAFTNGWSQIQSWWDTGWAGFAGKLENGRQQINTWATTSATQMAAPWANGWSQIAGAFGNGWSQISGWLAQTVGGIARFVGQAIGTLASLPGQIGGIFAGAGAWLVSAGANIVRGLISGIQGMIQSAASAAAALARATVNAAMSALNINSPSKVFRGIGLSVGEGYVQGIDRSVASSMAAVEAMIAPPISMSVAGGTGAGYVGAQAGSSQVINQTINMQPMLDNDPHTTATLLGREFARRVAG